MGEAYAVTPAGDLNLVGLWRFGGVDAVLRLERGAAMAWMSWVVLG